MKRTQKNTVGNKVENTNRKWVVVQVHPKNDHFQFLRVRRWWDWVNNTSEAAIFNHKIDALRALSIHKSFNFASDAFVAPLS